MINLVDVEDSIINESKRKFFNDYIRKFCKWVDKDDSFND